MIDIALSLLVIYRRLLKCSAGGRIEGCAARGLIDILTTRLRRHAPYRTALASKRNMLFHIVIVMLKSIGNKVSRYADIKPHTTAARGPLRSR